MSDEATPAGYQITRETDIGKETEPHCVTCVERDGLLVWDHQPIAREAAEHDAIKCDVCGQMLIVDYLQRQIDTAGRLLRDCYQLLEYGGIGTIGWPSTEDWRRMKRLKEQLEPYFYEYANLETMAKSTRAQELLSRPLNEKLSIVINKRGRP